MREFTLNPTPACGGVEALPLLHRAAAAGESGEAAVFSHSAYCEVTYCEILRGNRIWDSWPR